MSKERVKLWFKEKKAPSKKRSKKKTSSKRTIVLTLMPMKKRVLSKNQRKKLAKKVWIVLLKNKESLEKSYLGTSFL